jgi:hypothetical protein
MAYGTGGDDGKGYFILFGGIILVTAAVAVYAAVNGGPSGPAERPQTFQEAIAIPEGETRTCPVCKGKKWTTCGVCGGAKKLNYIDVGLDYCYSCKGNGWTQCTLCKGSGKIGSAQSPGSIKVKPPKTP